MEIIIENESDLVFSENEIICKMVESTLEFENLHSNVEVSVLIVNNKKIKELNKEYRNIDRETDVLSFPLIEPKDVKKIFATEKIVFLGDIVISNEKIITQSREYGHSFERELAFLITHSVLHLLGYDHLNENDEKIMFEKQENILNKAGFIR